MAERSSYIAPDGWFFLLPVLAALLLATGLQLYALVPVLVVLLVLLVLLFRDPVRAIPANPKGVVSPVDGRVIRIGDVPAGALHGAGCCICIRVDNLGAYAARSPIEGLVTEFPVPRPPGWATIRRVRGLWVRGDDGCNVGVVLHAAPLLGRPRALVRYGERVGQGQRCAWLRLAREAEVFLPAATRVAVRPGERVRAGSTVLAELPRG